MSDDKIKSKLPGISDIPQKPIRTYEQDMAEAIAKLNKTDKNVKTNSFIQPVVIEPEVKPEIKSGIETVVYNDKWHRVAPWPNIPPVPTPVPTPIEKIVTPTEKIKEKIEVKPEIKTKVETVVHNDNWHRVAPRPNVPIEPPKKIEEKISEAVKSEIAKEKIRNYEDAIADALARQKSSQEKKVDHPLQILHNQVEPIILKPEVPRKMVRTYEEDVAHTITRDKPSILTMAMAESERRGDDSISNLPPSQIGKKISLVILSIIFIMAGIGGGYYLYLKSPLAKLPIINQSTKIASIVNPDIQKILNVPSLQKDKLIEFLSNSFKNAEVGEGKVLEFILTQTVGSTTKRVTGSQFINSLKFEITDALKRSLSDKWMIGVYSSSVQTEQGTQNLPFIILTTDFFQNAFSGMLKWESTMPDEFADIFDYEYNIRGTYKDRIIMNRDIREFISERGELLFLYTFIDKNTILITTSETVVPAILNRIEKQTYIR